MRSANPAATFVQTTTRSWVDGNRNFTPDCDLNSRAAQDNRASGGDLCGAWDVANFRSIATATVLNPAVLSRVMLRMRYPDLDQTARAVIWRTMFEAASLVIRCAKD